MTVGILTAELFIPESNSLKEKRMVLHSIKARLRNRFNCAVAQVDTEDKWQSAQLAIVGVEKSRATVNSMLSRAVDFLEGCGNIKLLDYELELI